MAGGLAARRQRHGGTGTERSARGFEMRASNSGCWCRTFHHEHAEAARQHVRVSSFALCDSRSGSDPVAAQQALRAPLSTGAVVLRMTTFSQIWTWYLVQKLVYCVLTRMRS